MATATVTGWGSKHREFVDLIIGIALKGRRLGFEFIKKDGSKRIAPAGRSFVRENNALRFWDSGVKEWRCCGNDSIVAIHLAGHRWTNPHDIVVALNNGVLHYGPEYIQNPITRGNMNTSARIDWESVRVW